MSEVHVEGSDILSSLSDESLTIEETCHRIVKEITSGRLTILRLVESLGELLTDKNEFKRLRGTDVLSRVLKELPKTFLNKQEIIFISEFFCDRLKDNFVVTPAVLRGLSSIASMKELEDPVKIILSLSQNVITQTLPQELRNVYYCIIEELMYNKTEELLKTPGEFVYAVISAMESENDPRNLVKLFDFLPFFLRSFPLKHLVEETFAVLECYFPVDFTPRDKKEITREELANGLEACLSSSSEFSPLVIPMILEKLDSQLKVAHIDSLKLLIRGCENWTLESINDNRTELWTALKKLIIPGSDPEISDLATEALVVILSKYSTSPLDKSQADCMKELLDDITASVHGFLSDPDLSLFCTATKLLGAVSQASSSTCQHIVYAILPQLLALLKVGTHKPDVVLKSLRTILNSIVKFNISQIKDDKIQNIMSCVAPNLLKALEHPKAKCDAYLCLSDFVSLLSEEQRYVTYSIIKNSIPKEKSEHIRISCSIFFKTVASLHSEEVKTHVLSEISSPSCLDGMCLEESKRRFDILCWACHIPPLTSFAVSKLVEKLTSGTVITPVALSSLRFLCESITDESIMQCIGIDCEIPGTLVKFWLSLSDEQKSASQICDESTLTDLSRTLDGVVKSLNSRLQQKIIDDCFPIVFNSFISNSTNAPTIAIILLEGLLGSLRKDVTIPNYKELASELISVAMNSPLNLANITSARLLANLVNKWDEGDELDEVLNEASKFIDKGKDNLSATVLVCWITKGLVLRAHPQMNLWLEKLVVLLTIERVQLEAAHGFQLILDENDQLLNRTSHCEIRILYKQRVFGVISKLVPLFDSSQEKTKTAVSMAIAFILKSVPRSLILGNLKELIRVIVGCIDSNDPEVVFGILDVLNGLLSNEEQVLIEYTDTFIPKCIHHSTSSSMKVRMEALECLYKFAKYKEIVILPYKNLVLNGLIKCLDDRKRLVRQKAVRARNKWFLLNSLRKADA